MINFNLGSFFRKCPIPYNTQPSGIETSETNKYRQDIVRKSKVRKRPWQKRTLLQDEYIFVLFQNNKL